MGLHIQKEGYYPTDVIYELGTYNQARWSLNPAWQLKRIVKPIAMYAKRIDSPVPAEEKAVGYDFKSGDWVAPYGKGTHADAFFTAHFDKPQPGQSNFTLTVSFPNTGDGIQEFKVPPTRFPRNGSKLRSPHQAPQEDYQPQWIQLQKWRSGKLLESNQDGNRNFFFRIHTVLDESGRVKSALYGKIYGDFMNCTYYLNPSNNDRNLEFDPKLNLLKGLKLHQVVREP